MFDWFKKPNYSNVVQFPKSEAPIFPDQVPYEDEKPAVTYYRLGMTSNGRVSLAMGYSEITMNHQGVQQMIDQLAFFQSQLNEDQDEE
jgi:hypothetical protein